MAMPEDRNDGRGSKVPPGTDVVIEVQDDREKCVGCGARAPRTDTNYTLISQRHGWRLTRSDGPDGKKISEWRCPVCYAKLREKRRA
jgi:hypothetical protein